ncbi:MAG: heavy metal translocating P-type ATPase [Pigmentiphaga sp.]
MSGSHRHSPAPARQQDHAHQHGGGACCATAPLPAFPTAAAPVGAPRFQVPAMDCAAEESEIRLLLGRHPGVAGLGFDLGARQLTIDAEGEALETALAALRRAGFPATALDAAGPASRPEAARWRHARLAGALVLALVAELMHWSLPDTPVPSFAGMAVAAVAILLAGFSVYRKGLAALARGRLNITALMTVAVTGAFLIGQWPEAAMVMALYALAETIEARAVDRARHAIQGLMALAPDTAEWRVADGRWRRAPVDEVAVGARVRVRPGERIPLDGTVAAGYGGVDQAPVTGESVPVDKVVGDAVFAGTVNLTGELELTVTAPAGQSTISRIIQAVEQAQAARAPAQRLVDRFAAVYTPAVFGLAVLVAVLPPWLWNWTWLDAVYRALVLLVIACPCALVIATPVTIVSALTAAARRGVLVKGGIYLEQARRLRVVALDKTGTLTEGKPLLVAFEPLPDSEIGAEAIASLAHSLAQRSDHPVSRAIATGVPAPELALRDFSAWPGRGTRAWIDDRRYGLVNRRGAQEMGLPLDVLNDRLAAHEAAGRTVSLLVDGHRVLAICAVADRLRAGAAEAVAELEALGLHTVMLTGDNFAAASAVAAQAGLAEVRGPLLPEDKLAAIAELRERYGLVAMAGDGINDAPALARADVGFAMGAAGTQAAMEAADVVVMNDDLRRLPETVRLSRQAVAVLWQNIVLALGIKLVFLVLAMAGMATLWMAVFADVGASLLVVANGLRLLRGVVR